MRIHIEILRGGDQVKERLLADGWRLDQPGPNRVSAYHLSVVDEETARFRLYQLNLLIHPGLRIEFQSAMPIPDGITGNREN